MDKTSAPLDFIKKVEKKMWAHIYRADFDRGLAVIENALKKYPHDFTLLHHFGVNTADAAEAFHWRKKRK